VRGSFGDAEADVYRAAGKVLGFVSRVRLALGGMGVGAYIHVDGGMPVRVGEALGWFDEFTSALEQWRGAVKSVYVVPGAKPGDAPEERTR
jgi:hypothetical protein